MKLPLFIILIGMVTILFAGVRLKTTSQTKFERPRDLFITDMYNPEKELKSDRWADTIPLFFEGGTIQNSVYSEKFGSVIATQTDSSRIIEITDSSEDIVAYWEKGKWTISNCEKSIAVTLHCLREITDLLNKRRVEEVNENPVKPVVSKWTDAVALAPTTSKLLGELPIAMDTLPKQSYIQFQETGTSIFHNGKEVALRRKNGSWKVIDSRKALEVMYNNIYKRDSVRRSK